MRAGYFFDAQIYFFDTCLPPKMFPKMFTMCQCSFNRRLRSAVLLGITSVILTRASFNCRDAWWVWSISQPIMGSRFICAMVKIYQNFDYIPILRDGHQSINKADVWLGSSLSQRWMDRPVALGSASGVASTLILALLKTFVQEPFIDPPPLQLPLHCPQFELALEDIPLWTFAAGVFCGLLIGTLIGLLSLIRLRWRRLISRAFSQEQRRGARQPRETSRPFHKVVAWMSRPAHDYWTWRWEQQVARRGSTVSRRTEELDAEGRPTRWSDQRA